MPDVLSEDADPLSFGYDPGDPPPKELTPPDKSPDPAVTKIKDGVEKSREDIARAREEEGLRLTQEAIKRGNEAIDRSIQSAERETQIAKQRDIELGPRRDAALRSLEGVSAASANRPQLEKPPKPPQRNDPHADENWLMTAGLLGAIAGSMTRRHATNAMAAFSGAIDGYNEGSREKFNQNMEIWKAESQRVVDANKSSMDAYNAILNDKKLDATQKQTALEIEARRWDDKAMAQAAATKNDLAIAHAYDFKAQLTEKLAMSTGKFKDQYDAARQREWDSNAAKYVAENPDQIRDMLLGIIPPPQRNARTGQQGATDRAMLTELYRMKDEINPNWTYDLFKQNEARRVTMAKQSPEIQEARARQIGMNAEQRTLHTAGANINLIMQELGKTLANAANAANDVPATAFPTINRFIQRGAELSGDPAIKNFQLATLEVRDMFARAMNPRSSAIAVAFLQRATEYISTVDSPEAYDAALRNLARFSKQQYDAVQDALSGKPYVEPTLPPINRKLKPTEREFLPGGAGLTDKGREYPERVKRTNQMTGGEGPAPKAGDTPDIQLPPGWSFESLQPSNRS